jgi:hypothetical protein
VFFAIEPSTGREVPAELGRAGWIYRCPTCGARVQIRKAADRAVHFVHLHGTARPDCENYTPSRLVYRRRPPGEGRRVGPGIATSYLSFAMTIDGPRMGLWLPPAPDATWDGAIEVEAIETSRQFRAGNLRNGQRIEFPLVDGQWIVRDVGDVADEYLERIERGRQSLDISGSIFDASSTVGRQVLPGQSVAYGQALYWVTRVVLDPRAPGVRLCAVDKVGFACGWHIYKVELPEGAYSGDEFMELVQWLERRIRPARATVWIESPWPRATTDSGFPVFDPADGEIVIKADRPVDMRIADARTGSTVMERFTRQFLRVLDLHQGTYDLLINDLPHETFVVEAGGGSGAAVLIRMADQVEMALANGQPALDGLIVSRRRMVPLELTWAHPAVGAVVKLDGRALGQSGALGVSIQMRPGLRLDAEGLGALEWPAGASEVREKGVAIPFQLRARAKWLLSHANPGNERGGARVVVPDALCNEGVFQRLAYARWCAELSPQVRAMSKLLKEWE